MSSRRHRPIKHGPQSQTHQARNRAETTSSTDATSASGGTVATLIYRVAPGALLLLLVFLCYQPVWSAGFIWDDDDHLTANPCIIGPLGFKGIWTTSAATYYPLVLTTFWVLHAIWGLDPLPFHLFNVAMHAGCAILLWRVLLALRIRAAWFGAAVWALHPVQAESVAWITELKNTQSCLFYLLAISFFLRWKSLGVFSDRKGTGWDYSLVFLFLVLAVLSKASTVMLPAVLVLLCWWFGRDWKWQHLIKMAPFFLVSAAASIWTIWEQQYHSLALGAEWEQTWPERFIICGKAVWFYLGKLLWPHPLTFIYPRWNIHATEWISYLPLAALGLVALLLWVKRTGSMRHCLFVFLYFVILLFPVLGFFKVYFFRYSFVGDHFQYLASIGPLVLVGAGICQLIRAKSLAIHASVFAAVLGILGVLTLREAREYTDNEALWRATLADNPETWLANNNLGYILLAQGKLDEAITYYEAAVRIRPSYSEAHNNLGTALQNKGMLHEAIACYRKALAIEPDFPVAENNLGNALFQIGDAAGALEHYQRAIALNPDYANPHFNLGSILLSQRRLREAALHFEKALTLNPEFSDPALRFDKLAWALATSPHADDRDGARAVFFASHANRLSGGKDPMVLMAVAAANAEVGSFDRAVIAITEAKRLALETSDREFVEFLQLQADHYQKRIPFRYSASGR